jgi:hypothetical protein
MRRRSFLRAATGRMLAAAGPAHARASQAFVLVHGAWHGAWCWQRVVPLLEAHGHRVEAPLYLSGLRETVIPNEASEARDLGSPPHTDPSPRSR